MVVYDECHKLALYAECHYGECRYAECLGACLSAVSNKVQRCPSCKTFLALNNSVVKNTRVSWLIGACNGIT